MSNDFLWKNKPNYDRAVEIVDKMTVEEAASQLLHSSPAISRLGIPEYNWWSEGLHGVARAGTATVFPQAIGLAAMWDDNLLKKIAKVISTEARAKYNASSSLGDRDIYKGLTYWSPNINIFRDPRWGRGHETYGEDPYLTSRYGVSFIKGLQGDGKYLRVAACAKHFAAHSGPESLRHEFNAEVSPKDMNETYLPAFKTAVKEAGVESVMGAYNRTNGEPCCASQKLLVDILRNDWKFDGHVVSDCWAVKDFHTNHHYTKLPMESASLAVRMGCDLNCGCTYEHLLEGLDAGLITEKEIKTSATRLMQTRERLGLMSDDCEYDAIPYTVVNDIEHQKLALKAAEESIVLLKNDGILPLDTSAIKTVGVIGPNAYSEEALYGNYNGDSDNWITNLDGLREYFEAENIRIIYSLGAHLWKTTEDGLAKPGKYLREAITVAKYSDLIILNIGLDGRLEGEEGDTGNSDASGDKKDLLLPKSQRILCEKVLALGKPVIMVLNSGSSIDLSAYENKVSAIIQCWYSGEKGGKALANVISGKTSPAGRLPLTFYYNENSLPDFTDYSMHNRTYRYYKDKVWYPFGYGLSYARIEYSNLRKTEDGAFEITAHNISDYDSDEVVEIYIRYEGDTFEKPLFSLCGFKRIHLVAGESKTVKCTVSSEAFENVLEDGTRKILPGAYTLFAGGNAPDSRSVELTGNKPLELRLDF